MSLLFKTFSDFLLVFVNNYSTFHIFNMWKPQEKNEFIYRTDLRLCFNFITIPMSALTHYLCFISSISHNYVFSNN